MNSAVAMRREAIVADAGQTGDDRLDGSKRGIATGVLVS